VHTNYLHYSWSFGDGSHSTNHDPWHYYTAPGTYYVCLTVTDSNATGTCSDTWCDSVTIVAPHTPVCNAEFHYYHLTPNPDSLHFYPVVTTAQHYSWSFGDGTVSTDLYPWHNFAPGSYYVCLTVTDSNATGTCSDTWCDSVTIVAPHAPLCNAEFTFYTITNPVSYHFIPSINNYQTYLWDFGDGIQSTNHDPWHTYTNLGNYIVCLTVTDSNSIGTCTDTWCDTVSVSHHFVSNVNLFANPASNIITVNIQNIIPPALFMISDLQGREVYLNNAAVNGPFVLSLNGNTSGIYFYTLIDADSNKYSGKVIVIHN
jgi:PKD repeat protein